MPFGEYYYNLDDKGRVVIPPPFRDFVAGGMVLSRGQEGFIYVFPKYRWEEIEAKLRGAPLLDYERQSLIRWLYMPAHFTKMDRSGRILIPPQLRKYAGLKDEVVVLGGPDRLEIWDSERWQRWIRQPPPISREQLREIGI